MLSKNRIEIQVYSVFLSRIYEAAGLWFGLSRTEKITQNSPRQDRVRMAAISDSKRLNTVNAKKSHKCSCEHLCPFIYADLKVGNYKHVEPRLRRAQR